MSSPYRHRKAPRARRFRLVYNTLSVVSAVLRRAVTTVGLNSDGICFVCSIKNFSRPSPSATPIHVVRACAHRSCVRQRLMDRRGRVEWARSDVAFGVSEALVVPGVIESERAGKS